MSTEQDPVRLSPEEDDPVTHYRERLLEVVAIATAVFLLPFMVNNFIQGRPVVGAITLAVTAILAADALAIQRSRKTPVPVPLMVVLIAPAIILSAWTEGIGPMLWSYPIVLLFYFTIRRRIANVLTAVLIVALTLLSARVNDLGLTVRLAVTLALTAVIGNVLVHLIGELYRKLMEQAISDPLTGVYNRRHLGPSLDEAMERSRRSGAPVSLIVADIDHFKQINDRYGHAAGDAVLRGVAALLIGRKRKLDVVFRIGGEEFVLLLPDAGEEDAVHVAEELRMSVASAPLLHAWAVMSSFGVAGLRSNDSADSWLKAADDALYLAKRNGRNLVVRREQVEASRIAAFPQRSPGMSR